MSCNLERKHPLIAIAGLGIDGRHQALGGAKDPATMLRPALPLLDLDMVDFAQRLRELRIHRQLSQGQTAELADVLGASADELAHHGDSNDQARTRNTKVHQLVHKIHQLPDARQQALILVIDSTVKCTSLHHLTDSSPRKRANCGPRACQ